MLEEKCEENVTDIKFRCYSYDAKMKKGCVGIERADKVKKGQAPKLTLGTQEIKLGKAELDLVSQIEDYLKVPGEDFSTLEADIVEQTKDLGYSLEKVKAIISKAKE